MGSLTSDYRARIEIAHGEMIANVDIAMLKIPTLVRPAGVAVVKRTCEVAAELQQFETRVLPLAWALLAPREENGWCPIILHLIYLRYEKRLRHAGRASDTIRRLSLCTKCSYCQCREGTGTRSATSSRYPCNVRDRSTTRQRPSAPSRCKSMVSRASESFSAGPAEQQF